MKIPYHTASGTVAPFPRDGAPNPIPDGWEFLDIAADPLPEDFNQATHRIKTTHSRVGDTWHGTHEVVPIVELPAITPRQLRLELLNRGLLANVEAAIASLPEPQKTGALIEWEYSTQFLRAHPMVSAIAAAVGISSETLDDIFAAAAGI